MKKKVDVQEEVIDEVNDDVEEPTSITPQERTDAIFGKYESWEDRKVSEFVSAFGISEKELMSIVSQYKKGRGLMLSQQAEQNRKMNAEKASDLANKESVEAHSVEVAELLVRNHGFRVTDVKAIGFGKKTWKLVKI